MKKSLGLLASVLMIGIIPTTNLNLNIKTDASSSTEDLLSSPETKKSTTDAEIKLMYEKIKLLEQVNSLQQELLKNKSDDRVNQKKEPEAHHSKTTKDASEPEIITKKDLQLSDLLVFSVEPEVVNNTHFFYSKASVEKSPVVITVKPKYLETLKFKYLESFTFKENTFCLFEETKLRLKPKDENQQLILTVKDEYKEIIELFGGDKDTRTITFTFWLKPKISEAEIIYSLFREYIPLDSILLQSLTSKKGNTAGCKIIQTACIELYCLQLQQNPTYTKQEYKKFQEVETSVIKWYGKDSEKHKKLITEQEKTIINDYPEVDINEYETYKAFERDNTSILNIEITNPWIDFDQSYYVEGTVDKNTNDFTPILNTKKVLINELKLHKREKFIRIKKLGIYQLYLKDKWGHSYVSYIEVGLDNWKLKGSINEPTLLKMLAEGIVTFEKDNLTSFDLYSNATIYKKYWLIKYQSEVLSYINTNLHDWIYQYLQKAVRGFEDQSRVEEITRLLNSSLEVKKKLSRP